MRATLLAIFTLVLFSCGNHYQYLTISSENTSSNENNEFVAKTNGLEIVYNFHGKNGPVNISINNKSEQALQIDWKRSSLIIGNRPVAFHKQNLNLTGNLTKTGYTRDHSINATIQGQEGIEFIPPRSVVYRSGLFIQENQFDIQSFPATDEKIKVKGFNNKAKKISFTKANSPLNFRSYLTFITNGTDSESFSVEHSFYLSELIDTKAEPAYVWSQKDGKGNKFFMDHSSRNAYLTGTILGLGLVTVLVVAEAQK